MVLKMCCRTRAFCNQLVLGIITVLQTVSAAMCATGGRTISLKVATWNFNQTLYCILFLSFFNVSSRVWLVCLCLGHSSSQDVKDVRNMSLWAARDHRSILHIYLSNPKKINSKPQRIILPLCQMPWTLYVVVFVKLFFVLVYFFDDWFVCQH